MKKIIILSVISFVSLTSFDIFDFTCIFLPPTPFNYANIPFPSDIVNNLSEMDNTPLNNPTTDAGATLGRVLFYDADLSKNHTVSCATCHIQKFSFTDTARFSVGFNGGLTPRNSMGLIHARFQRDSSFFWDNRAATLEIQTLMPIQNSVEMGLTLDTLVARVSAKSFYPPLFQSAFGSSSVTSDGISKALAQFIRSMNTFGSRYRQGVEITSGNPSVVPFPNFTAQENLGKDLFMDINRGNCQACHTRNIMVQQGAQNIGLDTVYSDNGVGALTGNPNSGQNGKFSVPSLINVELTAPYMHDGRYATLEQVINFYSDSVKPHPNLSGFLREIVPGNPQPNNNPCLTCPPRKINYTPAEKQALIAFLKTLTDTVITNDVRWSNPFCKVVVLPVIFNEVKAIKVSSGIEVLWSTATEINCDKFEVERSIDGVRFETICTKKGSGSSSLVHTYEAMDYSPEFGINYYRIKEINFDGEVMYSKIVSEKNDFITGIITLSPNPASGNIIYLQSAAELSHVDIFESNGKILKSVKRPTGSIDISFLPKGAYYFRFYDINGRIFIKRVLRI